jgi:hypothetical protein
MIWDEVIRFMQASGGTAINGRATLTLVSGFGYYQLLEQMISN